MKKSIIGFLIMFVIITNITSAASKNIWTIISDSSEYEASGELELALPLWLDIISYFEDKPGTKDNYTNLALFSKKVAKYYDDTKQYDDAVYHYEKENEYWNIVGENWGAEDMLRADQIRTSFEYFAKIPAPKVSNLEKNEPNSGIYLGIYSENDYAIGQNFEKTKTVLGEHAMFLLYQEWNQIFVYSDDAEIDTTLANRIKDENAAFHIAMNSIEGLDAIERNTWIINWAKEANKLDMPIFLRFLGEMNGDWVPWGGNPELYIEKFRLVHDVMEEYAPNVSMVWAPNDVPVEYESKRIEDYYPGDDYVDWVGVNFYIDYYDSGVVTEGDNFLQNPLSHLDYVYDLYADKKPIMISETSVTHYSIPNDKDVTKWAIENLKKFYSQLPIKYPKVKAINYFSLNQANSNYVVGNRWNNYAISENKPYMETYKELIASDSYLGTLDDKCDFTYKKISDGSEMKNENEIFFVIKIADYAISKVEFYNDDVLIGSDKILPYSLRTDFSSIENLKVKVYDSKGALNSTKIIGIGEGVVEEVIEEEPSENIEKEVVKSEAGDIEVTVPPFKININGVEIDNQSSKYPFLLYKNITYFPMTWHYSQALGLKTSWSDKKGLSIDIDNKIKGKVKYDKDGNNKANQKNNAATVNYGVTVNKNKLDNTSEEYPLFNFRGVTYFPMSWKFAVEEFGWDNKWNEETGLSITNE